MQRIHDTRLIFNHRILVVHNYRVLLLLPEMRKSFVKCTSVSLPNRLELSLRDVFALPNASKIGLALKSFAVVVDSVEAALAVELACSPDAAAARYAKQCLVVSVFPAPDSPLTRIDCGMRLSSSLS